jgi:hypothetical protein
MAQSTANPGSTPTVEVFRSARVGLRLTPGVVMSLFWMDHAERVPFKRLWTSISCSIAQFLNPRGRRFHPHHLQVGR